MRAPMLAFALLVVACDTRQNFARPEWTDQRMLDQPRYAPFEESAFWGDGTSMRPPVPGTVARGSLAAESDAPLPVTRELLALGRESFDVVCAACHGVLGDGVSVVATKMQERPPPSLHDAAIASLPAQKLYEVVSDGYGLMMPMKSLLSARERWAVVAYVEALILSQRIQVTRLAPSDRARLEAVR